MPRRNRRLKHLSPEPGPRYLGRRGDLVPDDRRPVEIPPPPPPSRPPRRPA